MTSTCTYLNTLLYRPSCSWHPESLYNPIQQVFSRALLCNIFKSLFQRFYHNSDPEQHHVFLLLQSHIAAMDLSLLLATLPQAVRSVGVAVSKIRPDTEEEEEDNEEDDNEEDDHEEEEEEDADEDEDEEEEGGQEDEEKEEQEEGSMEAETDTQRNELLIAPPIFPSVNQQISGEVAYNLERGHLCHLVRCGILPAHVFNTSLQPILEHLRNCKLSLYEYQSRLLAELHDAGVRVALCTEMSVKAGIGFRPKQRFFPPWFDGHATFGDSDLPVVHVSCSIGAGMISGPETHRMDMVQSAKQAHNGVGGEKRAQVMRVPQWRKDLDSDLGQAFLDCLQESVLQGYQRHRHSRAGTFLSSVHAIRNTAKAVLSAPVPNEVKAEFGRRRALARRRCVRWWQRQHGVPPQKEQRLPEPSLFRLEQAASIPSTRTTELSARKLQVEQASCVAELDPRSVVKSVRVQVHGQHLGRCNSAPRTSQMRCSGSRRNAITSPYLHSQSCSFAVWPLRQLGGDAWAKLEGCRVQMNLAARSIHRRSLQLFPRAPGRGQRSNGGPRQAPLPSSGCRDFLSCGNGASWAFHDPKLGSGPGYWHRRGHLRGKRNPHGRSGSIWKPCDSHQILQQTLRQPSDAGVRVLCASIPRTKHREKLDAFFIRRSIREHHLDFDRLLLRCCFTAWGRCFSHPSLLMGANTWSHSWTSSCHMRHGLLMLLSSRSSSCCSCSSSGGCQKIRMDIALRQN